MKSIVSIWLLVAIVVLLGPISSAGLVACAAGYTLGELVYQGGKRWATYWRKHDQWRTR